MSHAATAWARREGRARGLSSAQRFILIELADAHNGHTGECFPSQASIALATDYTERAVRKALDAMEALGLFSRVIEKNERGQVARTRYLLPADLATGQPPARDAGGKARGQRNDVPVDVPGPPPAREKADSAQPPEPRSAGPAEPRAGGPPEPRSKSHRNVVPGNLEYNLTGKHTPLPPKPAEAATAAPGVCGIDFPDFEKVWPWEPGEPKQAARRVFEQLPPGERRRVIAAAPRYAAGCAAAKRKRKYAASWLRDGDWIDFDAAAAAADMVFVEIATPEWDAWIVARRREGRLNATGRLPTCERRGRQGWWFPSRWPPGAEPPPKARAAPPGSGPPEPSTTSRSHDLTTSEARPA